TVSDPWRTQLLLAHVLQGVPASMWPRWATRGEREVTGRAGAPRAASMWPRWATRGEPRAAPGAAAPGAAGFNVATVGDPWRTVPSPASRRLLGSLQCGHGGRPV